MPDALVIDQHEEHHRDQARDAGPEALADGIGAQRRAHRPLFLDTSMLAGSEPARRFSARSAASSCAGGAGDSAGIADPALDGRRADHLAIHHDRGPVADIGFGVALEASWRHPGSGRNWSPSGSISPCAALASRMSVPRTIGMRDTRYQLCCAAAQLPSEPAWCSAAERRRAWPALLRGEVNGPSFTSSHSSTPASAEAA